MPIYYFNHISAFGVIDGANSLLELFLVLVVFIVPIFTDTMAFCVGKTLKGKKLAPKISPNKTISGAIGGLIDGIGSATSALVMKCIKSVPYKLLAWLGITVLTILVNFLVATLVISALA